MIIPALPFILAGSETEGAGAINGRVGNSHTVDISMEWIRSQLGHVQPIITPVKAFIYAINFNAGPYGVTIPMVDDHVGGSGCSDWAFFIYAHVQFVPSLASVAGAKALWASASKYSVCMRWVNSHGPDLKISDWRIDGRPVNTVIIATEQS